MVYIKTVYELDPSKLMMLMLSLGILIALFVSLIIRIKKKEKDVLKTLLSIFIILLSALMSTIYCVEIMSPVQYFDCNENMTVEQVEQFKEQYAILDSVGNIYRVKEKEIFK